MRRGGLPYTGKVSICDGNHTQASSAEGEDRVSVGKLRR